MENAECLLTCFFTSNYVAVLYLFVSLALISTVCYFISRDGMSRVKYYWLLNVFVLSVTALAYLIMDCEMLWFLRIYFGYVVFAALFLLAVPKLYTTYLSKRYTIERNFEFESLLSEWSTTKARLYIFGSALPKAFTVGKNVFISAGMVDLMNIEEIKAVIAHEAFHVSQNKYPFINNFKILTFILLPETQLETAADSYAEEIMDKDILLSAKNKIREFYLD